MFCLESGETSPHLCPKVTKSINQLHECLIRHVVTCVIHTKNDVSKQDTMLLWGVIGLLWHNLTTGGTQTQTGKYQTSSVVFSRMLLASGRLARSYMNVVFAGVFSTACSSLQYCNASSHVFTFWTRISLSSVHMKGWLWLHLSTSQSDPFLNIHQWTLPCSSATTGKERLKSYGHTVTLFC